MLINNLGITLAIPPEFPIVMTMGIIFSLSKLKQKSIYCINPEKIRSAGRVAIMVFDKTGTLTESGLACHSYKIDVCEELMKEVHAGDLIIRDKNIWMDKTTYLQHQNKKEVKYAECQASCHSLALFNGEFLGDTLDIEMFISSKWTMKVESENLKNKEGGMASFYPP